MRLVLIVLVALLVLGGGGAGAYFFFFKPQAEASAGESAQSQEEQDSHKHKKEAKKGKGGHDEGHSEFVEMDPLILPIIDASGVNQTISLVIALEIPDPAMVPMVESMTPRLKDAFIQEMYGSLNKHAALKGGVIQVEQIKKQLAEIAKQVLGDDSVSGVFLQVVQQRPV